MAGRRPGPTPKNPDERLRTNADPVIGKGGWTDIQPAPFAGEVPPIPAWVRVGDVGRAAYEDLSRLPQAVLWGPGTWLQLHLTLPLIERYLSRPGSENFKAITSTLGAGLRMTEDDLQKARVRIVEPPKPEDAAEVDASKVTDIKSRRSRLTSDAS